MKGIILAGGNGTRLYPLTKVISKQLLPVYDKPMIYYPLSTLMLAGIKDILIISTPKDISRFKELLGTGNKLGINLDYVVQVEPKGLAHAFIVGEEFIDKSSVCLILGDNIFYGAGLRKLLQRSKNHTAGNNIANIYGYNVNNPKRYGVVEFDSQYQVLSIEEKPTSPKSNFAIPGLYFFPNDVINFAKVVEPSEREEVEISSVINSYLNEGRLKCTAMGRGYAWLDTGTHDSILEASNFIETIEKRQGQKVACLEEIAYSMNFISKKDLTYLARSYNNDYGKYLEKILE